MQFNMSTEVFSLQIIGFGLGFAILYWIKWIRRLSSMQLTGFVWNTIIEIGFVLLILFLCQSS